MSRKVNAGPDYEREVRETGAALADEAFKNGHRLTEDEQAVLTHWTRFGSDGYPVSKLGAKWRLDSPLTSGVPLFKTKYAAVRAWEIIIAKLIRLKGLEAYERATKAAHA